MGFFSNLFNKDKKNDHPEDASNEEERPIFWVEADDKMAFAYKKARESFQYFWRELSWEYRRIIPAHGFAAVKVPFSQTFSDRDQPIVEHMWVNEINFDGNTIYGVLMNNPNQLTNVNVGDPVEISVQEISDWIFSIAGRSYGGFTIQALRSDMTAEELPVHDNAWGLDFGDCNEILVAYEQKEHPENLIEHPMSVNMKDKFIEFIEGAPEEIHATDVLGHTVLHSEAIAGNKTSIEVLIKAGVDLQVKTKDGKTALDFAKALHWDHLIPILQ